jgi:hypothetical protein
VNSIPILEGIGVLFSRLKSMIANIAGSIPIFVDATLSVGGDVQWSCLG